MEKHNSIQMLWDKLQQRSGAEALAAAVFSVCVSIPLSQFISSFFYRTWPAYSEFAAGDTVYEGYNKEGDMCFFYLLYVLIPIFFLLFLWIKHSLDNKYGIKKKTILEESAKISCGVERKTKDTSLLTVSALGLFAIMAVETALGGRFVTHRNFLSAIGDVCSIIWIVLVLVFVWIDKRKKLGFSRFRKPLINLFQLVLPLAFLGYFRFYYEYEKEAGLIELYHSAKWELFCVLMYGFFFLIQCLRIHQKKYSVSLWSLIVIATMSVAKTPEGILSVDFFHNGEMALPMQQLLSYGKIPYFDLDPIHGFCDFFYSIFNYIFFDGSYFSQNAAIMTGQLFMAAILAVVLGACAYRRDIAIAVIWLFMPFLVERAGVRYLIFFAAFLLLLSERIQKNSHFFLWCYALLCMLGIAFHISIGASLAVAFLPEVLYRFWKEVLPELSGFFQKSREEKRRLLLLYGSLLFFGMLYIPWFLQILRFLRENANTTLWVNGTIVFGTEFKPVETFAFLAAYLGFLIAALRKSKKGKSAFISMAFCMLIISNYACVRYDAGLRLGVLGVFFGILFLLYASSDFTTGRSRGIYNVFVLVLCLYICRDYVPLSSGTLLKTEWIPAKKEIEIQEEKISDPVVYVSGDSVGMPKLGTGFIQGSTLNSLKNVQTVLDAEEAWDSYLDLTNKISHAVIFDSEVKYFFTSGYNISNDLLQEKAIKSIQEQRPRLILLSPYIRFDQAPVSLRSPKLYGQILAMGYQPYFYEDVIYFLDGESQFAEAGAGERRLGNLNHKTDLGMLPYLWATVPDAERGLTEIDADSESLNGREAACMEITASAKELLSEEFILEFQSDVDGEFYQFCIKTGIEKLKDSDEEVRYLIPLNSSPFFYYSDNVHVRIEGINVKEQHIYKVN